MRRSFLRISSAGLLGLVLGTHALKGEASTYKEIEWDDLMPEGWRKKMILEVTRMRRYGSL
ncbi:MAG: hypothetical protein EBY94_08885, partial [Burkholderiaceae bacterium]|nr:hypothetical protein [Burkholderiaceae bacterium]